MANRRDQLRAVLRRQRESHRTLFDLQGQSIDALREALNAIGRTHDEMTVLFECDDALDDIGDDNSH